MSFLKPNTFAWEEYSNRATKFSLNRLFLHYRELSAGLHRIRPHGGPKNRPPAPEAIPSPG